jgi:phosphoribosyl 1,2-cyclic phosphodiesterase
VNHGSLVKLHSLGTRGNIEARTAEHGKHSVLAVGYRGRQVMIDCGRDWLNEAPEWDADAIVITHAHPDHVDGLKRGVPYPVYATADTWKTIGNFPVRESLTLRQRRKHRIAGMTFEAFAVEHSVRAPAVGYRITAGNTVIFYCPDLVSIHDRRAALRGITAYIGDGATISRSFVRRRGNRLIGHAPIDLQLGWCKQSCVPRAIITHCGTQIVTAAKRALREQIDALRGKYGLRVEVAQDGMELTLRTPRRIGTTRP